MNVEIRVDAPQALTTISAVEAGLAKVEAHGPAVNAALSQGFGNSSTAAEKTKQSTTSLTEALTKLANTGKAFSGLDEVFKREADILQKIHGPAKDYAADLQALDMLLQKNSITTDEYAAHVTKMNQAIESTGKSADKASSPTDKLSGTLAAFALPSIGASILGVGQKIDGLVQEYAHLADVYTVLENKALKFADSIHSTNTILAEQQALSVQLHSTMNPTIELYDQVRDGSDNLRISHQEQIRVTKTLAEAMQIANKPIEEAGGLMTRFAFAMETGTLSGGEFKRMAKDVPELADLWSKHWGVSVAQLKTMIEVGKVGPRDLMNALITDFAKTDADFAKRKATNEQSMAEWKESVAKNKGEGLSDMSAVFAAGVPRGSDMDYQIRYGAHGDEKKQEDQGRAAIQQVLEHIEDVKNLTGEYRKLGDAQDVATKKMFQNMVDLIPEAKALGQAVLDLGSNVGLMSDAWEHSLSPFGRTMKLVMDNAAKVGDAKQQLVALQAAMKSGLGGDTARKQYEELMTTINDGRLPATIKMWDALHEPMRTFHEDQAAVNALWKAGTLSATDYQYELLQLAKTDPGLQRYNEILADQVKRYDAAAAAAKRYREAAEHGDVSAAAAGINGSEFAGSNRQALSDYSTEQGIEKTEADKQAAAEKRYQDVVDSSASSIQKYYEELGKLEIVQKDGTLSSDQYSTALQNIKEKYSTIDSPQQKFNKEIEAANELFGASLISFSDYEKKLQEVGKEQEKLADSGKNFGSGISRGLHSIRDQVTDVASTISSTMKSAFDEINSDIIDTVTKGSADWGKLASDIEADFAKIALQSLEAGAVSSLTKHATDTAGAAATGATIGTTASTTMGIAALGIGTTIGTTAAGIIAGAAALSSAASGVSMADSALMVAGSWAGSDTMIHAANGYAGRVRGVAGTDTKLFAAMVTPGESVAIRTPQQMAAQQRGAGGQRGPTIINKYDTRGELAAGLAAGEHDTAIVNVLRRNKGALQSLLKK